MTIFGDHPPTCPCSVSSHPMVPALVASLHSSIHTGSGFNYEGGDAGGGGDGGGGFASGSQNSPNNRPRKSYDEQTLIPVTIRMVLNSQPAISGDGSFQLTDGRELHQVKLIGAVRSADSQSTAVTYQIEDGTGIIEVKEFINEDVPAMVAAREEAAQDHVYVCIIGQVKDYDNKKSIIGNSVRKIESMNQLTHHMLEVAYSAEKYKKADQIVGAPQGGFGAPAGVGFGGGPVGKSAMGGMGMAAPAAGGANELQQTVLQFVREHGGTFICIRRCNDGNLCIYSWHMAVHFHISHLYNTNSFIFIGLETTESSDEGVNIAQVIAGTTAGGRFSEKEVRDIVEHLATEGEIYSTIDENTFKVAE